MPDEYILKYSTICDYIDFITASENIKFLKLEYIVICDALSVHNSNKKITYQNLSIRRGVRDFPAIQGIVGQTIYFNVLFSLTKLKIKLTGIWFGLCIHINLKYVMYKTKK